MYWRPPSHGQGSEPSEPPFHLDQPDLDASSPEAESLVEDLRADLRSAYAELRRAAVAEWQDLRGNVAELGARAAVGACFVAFGLAASIAAALLFLRGVHAALAAWTESEAVADLATGTAVLGVLVIASFAVRARRRATVPRAKHVRARR